MSIRRLLMVSREEEQEINITEVSVDYYMSNGYIYYINFVPSFVLGQNDRINVAIENSAGLYLSRDLTADMLGNVGSVLESAPVGVYGVLYNSVIVTITAYVDSQKRVFRYPNMNVTKRE